MAASGELA